MRSGLKLMIVIKYLNNADRFNETINSVMNSAFLQQQEIVCLNLPDDAETDYSKFKSIKEIQDYCNDDFFIFLKEGEIIVNSCMVDLDKKMHSYKACFLNNGFKNYFNLFFNNKLKWNEDLTPIDSNIKLKFLYFNEIEIISERSIQNDYHKKMLEAKAEKESSKAVSLFLESYTIEHRAEPLYYISRIYRIEKKYDLGHVFAEKAFKEKVKFHYNNIEQEVYDWKIADELAICSFGIKKYKEAYALNKFLLKSELTPEKEKERIKNNFKINQKHLDKKVKIKFQNKSKNISKIIAKISLYSKNIVELNRDFDLTGVIKHYSPEHSKYIKIFKNKNDIKKSFNSLKDLNIEQPNYKLFNEIVFIKNNIDFLILNDDEKIIDIALHLMWNKLKSKSKILITTNNYIKYLSNIEKVYPNYKKTGYSLIIKK